MCAKHKKTITERRANIKYGNMDPRSKAGSYSRERSKDAANSCRALSV